MYHLPISQASSTEKWFYRYFLENREAGREVMEGRKDEKKGENEGGREGKEDRRKTSKCVSGIKHPPKNRKSRMSL